MSKQHVLEVRRRYHTTRRTIFWLTQSSYTIFLPGSQRWMYVYMKIFSRAPDSPEERRLVTQLLNVIAPCPVLRQVDIPFIAPPRPHAAHPHHLADTTLHYYVFVSIDFYTSLPAPTAESELEEGAQPAKSLEGRAPSQVSARRRQRPCRCYFSLDKPRHAPTPLDACPRYPRTTAGSLEN